MSILSLTRITAYCGLFWLLWLFISHHTAYANHGPYSAELRVHINTASERFSWNKIEPSEHLVWTKCYADKECARLKVPLDYSNPDHASAAIALIRVRAKVPHDSPSYRGPVLINPGGPGGSGVDMVRGGGDLLSILVGPEFDIVGFDPRGIARSTPRASFFTSRAERELWFSSGIRFESLNASTSSLARAWAKGTILGQLAGERDVDGSLRFITTDHTARDMLRIVQAHGREKLQYWGFSYGSVLGATFAAMFPDKVERLVIDGVADAESYYDTDWSNFLANTDQAWQSFADGCVAAGPTGCAFYAPSTAELLSSVEAIYTKLRRRPIPVRGPTSYGLVDFSMLRATVFLALYSPYAMFPTLAHALAGLAKGDGTTLLNLVAALTPAPFECACDDDVEQDEKVQEGLWAVMCNDGKRIPPGYDEMAKHYQGMLTVSNFADQWEALRTACLAWPDFPKTHFQGPFIANTSFPLLIVGNTLDPVTPLSAAKKMSKGFGGSVVLTQDSVGHSSISAPSLCTQKHIRAYFHEGKLPEADTICDVDAEVFPQLQDGHESQQKVLSVKQHRIAPRPLSVEDRKLLDTVNELAMNVNSGLGRFPLGGTL
ncbi:TAP-like protein-domain-containing protein [Mycena amicta]|nr:TAP-like protein-domain-containing protein [Mycena amicta]